MLDSALGCTHARRTVVTELMQPAATEFIQPTFECDECA